MSSSQVFNVLVNKLGTDAAQALHILLDAIHERSVNPILIMLISNAPSRHGKTYMIEHILDDFEPSTILRQHIHSTDPHDFFCDGKKIAVICQPLFDMFSTQQLEQFLKNATCSLFIETNELDRWKQFLSETSMPINRIYHFQVIR